MSAAPAPTQPDAIPPRFAVERQLGHGLAATTYLARDQALDRLVVIKSVHGQGVLDPATRVRFEREARAAAAISHPNVVGVYDYGVHHGAEYLVLRYVDGETLRQHVARHGRFPAAAAVRIAGQILGGLGAIHAAGLIHRDIKPENVIVGGDGLLRVTDFGIAVAAADPRLTTQGQIWGTPAYMAPEQALGRPVSAATDVYAVGIILFELLTGRLPFNSKESAAMALAQISFNPPALRDIFPDTDASPALEAVLRRALEKDPGKRYQSAAAMAEELASVPPTSVSSPMSQVNDAPTVPLRSATQTSQPTIVTRLAPLPHHRTRRPRWAMLVLAVLILGASAYALSSGAALGFWKNRDDAAPTPTADARAGVQPTWTTSAGLAAEPSSTATVIPDPTQTTQGIVLATVTPTDAAPTVTKPVPTAIRIPATATQAAPTRTATKTAKRRSTQPTATIAVDGGIEAGGPTIAPVSGATSALAAQQFSASDWQGGFAGDQSWYGRPWIAVYGAQSQYPQATITFALDDAPTGEATLAIDGLDDEWPGNVAVLISVNDVVVFAGPSPWQTWNGEGQGENANWTLASMTVPAGTLHAGDNQIVVANTEPAANFATGPYVLLSDASIASVGP